VVFAENLQEGILSWIYCTFERGKNEKGFKRFKDLEIKILRIFL
jgi:hypothetical protein